MPALPSRGRTSCSSRRAGVATLLVSRSPFTEADADAIQRAVAEMGFTVQVSPWTEPSDARLGQIAKARTQADISAVAAADRDFDFSAPTDARPYFFNMLKPGAVFRHGVFRDGGIVAGNLRATTTLLGLLALALVLVGAIIVWPLIQSGRPELPPSVFPSAVAYFAIIGLGFMLIQIPMLQRFSLYLGHPTYTFSIVLFLMILAAGLGSLLSDRLSLRRGAPIRLPLAIGALILVETLLLQPAIDATMGWQLPGRTLVVAAFLVPLAIALGMCFPIGMRLVGRHSDRITAWMWGVNGATRRHRLDPRRHGFDVARDQLEPVHCGGAVRAPDAADAAFVPKRECRLMSNNDDAGIARRDSCGGVADRGDRPPDAGPRRVGSRRPAARAQVRAAAAGRRV